MRGLNLAHAVLKTAVCKRAVVLSLPEDGVKLARGRRGMGQLEELGMENLKDVLALEETCVFIFQLHGNWCQGSRRANVVRRLLPALPSVLSVFPE